jgi:hypothetical protein
LAWHSTWTRDKTTPQKNVVRVPADVLELAPPNINMRQFGMALTEHPECPQRGKPIEMSGFDHANLRSCTPSFKVLPTMEIGGFKINYKRKKKNTSIKKNTVFNHIPQMKNHTGKVQRSQRPCGTSNTPKKIAMDLPQF